MLPRQSGVIWIELPQRRAIKTEPRRINRCPLCRRRALQQSAPTASAIESGIQTSYTHQRDDLQGTAKRDMAAYRSTLLAQEQIAFGRFVQSVQARTQRAYEARAQELRERESALLLELARANAPTRLVLRAKLQTLALDTQTRRRLTNRLAALQDREDAAVAALRSTNARTLAAYARVLHERARSDVAKMHADLQTRTSANLAARERVLAAQTSSGGSLHMPTAQAHAGSEAEMLSQYNALVNAPSPDASSYANARANLTERFKALGAADAADTQSVKSQIASLAHDRAAVVERIRSQIVLEAKREAKARDLWLIYTSGLTPRGSVDITAAVAADLKHLSP